MASKKRICVIGAGPCGMSALYHFGNMEGGSDVDIVCYEKQSTWGGLWNLSWRTGTDEFGEHCHAGMYKHLWSNGPKECLEFPDYTFEDHFGKNIPSFPPRQVLQDYLEGKWTRKSKVDLRKYIKFNTVVRHVEYNDSTDTFTVLATDLLLNRSSCETFSHVIVAVGIFNTPNIPSFPGIETFEGRILHSHNFRDAKEFKGQRLLLIGASYSAEDLSLQCMKFGARSAICTWRSKPMGFKFPEGIEERPLIQKFVGNVAYFKDGSSADIDCVIMCTGYLYAFPFLDDNLRLRSSCSLYPGNLYKGTVWLGGGNNKLLYLGVQDQYYTFTMFESQALWACKYILEQIANEPKSSTEMLSSVQHWTERCSALKDCHDHIDFQTDVIADWGVDTGYSAEATKAREMFHKWEHDKDENIATYRDKCFASIFTGSVSPSYELAWWQAFDDSVESFVK